MFGFRELRKICSALCVTIICVVCLQTNIATIELLEHSLGVKHKASALAGAVRDCTSLADPCERNSEAPDPDSHIHQGDMQTETLRSIGPHLPTLNHDFAEIRFPKLLALAPSGRLAIDRPPKA
jgi:hypothetical protein